MDVSRRLLVTTVIFTLASTHLPHAAAQAYPARPIKVIVPSSPGGIVDVEVRRLAPHLSNALGQPVIIDNRPGASNTIGTALGAQSAPDGYTLTWGSTTALSVAPALMPSLSYDPLTDFEPIILYGRVPAVLVVNPGTGVRDIPQLVALARNRPGQLNYASNGPAGSLHILGEMLKVTLGIDIVHVPYKGAAPSLLSVLTGETQLAFDFPVTSAPHVRAGKLIALLVTGKQRVPLVPQVPTAAEAGYPQLEITMFGRLVAPRGTPAAVVSRLNAEMRKIMELPDIVAARESVGAEGGGGSPSRFRNVIAEELSKWSHIVTTAGVRME